MKKPDIETCYHEAGHAVAAVILGIPLERVDVYRNLYKNRIGFCKPKKGFHLKDFDKLNRVEKLHNNLEWARRSALMTLAGPAAQAKYKGVPVHDIDGTGGDFDDTVFKSPIIDFEHTLEKAISLNNESDIWDSVVAVSKYLENFWKIYPDTLNTIISSIITKQRMREIRFRYAGSL